MSLKSAMKLHQSTWILTSLNLSIPTVTIPGAVQPIFLFQKLRVSSANTFFYTRIREWNKLPTQVKAFKTHSQFKKAVKSHF